MNADSDLKAAESAVLDFLRLYEKGIDADDGPWIRACYLSAPIHTRLFAASFANDAEKAEQHERIAHQQLDQLLSNAKRDPIYRGAVGRLAEMLVEDQIPMPPKLGQWMASTLASSNAQKRADPRIGAKDNEKAVICEAVYIASEWLPIYSNSNPTYTAVDAVVDVLYRHFGRHYEPETIINYWKESKEVYEARSRG